MNPSENSRADLAGIFRDAVAAVDAGVLVTQALDAQLTQHLSGRRVIALAVGKAALPMAVAAQEALSAPLAHAIAIAPAIQSPPAAVLRAHGWQLYLGGHPLPDRNSLIAGHAVLAMAARLNAGDLLLVLLSGGASAMMVAPSPGISLEDKLAITQALLRTRASIGEINTVRKHLSQLKGGRLVAAANGAEVLALILSDVRGNDLATIGSGPTASDPSSFEQARAVLIRHKLWGRAHESVRSLLEAGMAGELEETLKAGDPRLREVRNVIVGDNDRALVAAANSARRRGFEPHAGGHLYGEARELGRRLARAMAQAPPRQCWLAGGEPVVEVRGRGRGGRAQELALAAALELERLQPSRPVALLCAGSDGVDGPTDAAGGFADCTSSMRARSRGLDPVAELARNNSYPVLAAAGDLFKSGATRTNVADLFIGLVY
jgi:glycerate 2-kinase